VLTHLSALTIERRESRIFNYMYLWLKVTQYGHLICRWEGRLITAVTKSMCIQF